MPSLLQREHPSGSLVHASLREPTTVLDEGFVGDGDARGMKTNGSHRRLGASLGPFRTVPHSGLLADLMDRSLYDFGFPP